jgi:hypothetical protein
MTSILKGKEKKEYHFYSGQKKPLYKINSMERTNIIKHTKDRKVSKKYYSNYLMVNSL